ncbi:uncharacterized protein KY384_001341 [Bacidia gigantensis]|uniref:uncharacterized protein n=1 Tax=Bacidia gigantensis TaxID=2732470 RepID=UPI001D04758B|nr:uncharacterized protein KY384_001341 [Bacidia gigantensis]KAG8533601.1 hypothetical protein KY384_001341 [Bacidia gigantensis]
MYSTLLLLTLAGLLKAQNTTVSLLLPFADSQSLLGSIVGADASATTYVIQCPEQKQKRQVATVTATSTAASSSGSNNDNSDENDDSLCGIPSPVTVIEGPSTLSFSLGLEDVTRVVDCKLEATTQAICSGTISGTGVTTDASNPAVQTATLAGTDLGAPIAVVITAGAEKLKSSGSSSSSASSSSSQSGGSSGASGTTAGAATATGTSAAASASKTGGGMRLEAELTVGMVGALAVGIAAILL